MLKNCGFVFFCEHSVLRFEQCIRVMYSLIRYLRIQAVVREVLITVFQI